MLHIIVMIVVIVVIIVIIVVIIVLIVVIVTIVVIELSIGRECHLVRVGSSIARCARVVCLAGKTRVRIVRVGILCQY